jgi:hypothetical protein
MGQQGFVQRSEILVGSTRDSSSDQGDVRHAYASGTGVAILPCARAGLKLRRPPAWASADRRRTHARHEQGEDVSRGAMAATMYDDAQCDCAADACMLAHGLQPKRIVGAALNRTKSKQKNPPRPIVRPVRNKAENEAKRQWRDAGTTTLSRCR